MTSSPRPHSRSSSHSPWTAIATENANASAKTTRTNVSDETFSQSAVHLGCDDGCASPLESGIASWTATVLHVVTYEDLASSSDAWTLPCAWYRHRRDPAIGPLSCSIVQLSASDDAVRFYHVSGIGPWVPCPRFSWRLVLLVLSASHCAPPLALHTLSACVSVVPVGVSPASPGQSSHQARSRRRCRTLFSCGGLLPACAGRARGCCRHLYHVVVVVACWWCRGAAPACAPAPARPCRRSHRGRSRASPSPCSAPLA